jgi:hypothetical protein
MVNRSKPEQDYLEKKKGIDYLKESTATYLDRRNRLLDHLVARFAESFSDYAIYMYGLPDEKVIDDESVSHELIKDKLDFLKNYPELSSQRSKAYDYSLREAEILGTKDISGYARRMMALLGMKFEKDSKLSETMKAGMADFIFLSTFYYGLQKIKTRY